MNYMHKTSDGGYEIKKFSPIVVLAMLSLCILMLSGTVYAAAFTVFGPKEYTRGTGTPTTSEDTCSVLNPNTDYILHIYNGAGPEQEKGKISSAVIWLNGEKVVTPNDFNQRVTHLERPITLSRNNSLTVQLRSKPGSTITIEIIGIDETPPEIIATLTPNPNAAGWNNSDVTVSFACSDTISGIASCSGPVLVQQEGAAQVITGIATDQAGNTASISATINIDKTPPVVTMLSPLPGATLVDSSTEIEGTVNDTLSGVAAVTCNGTPASLSTSSFTCNVPLTEGQNELMILASDAVGNTGQASVTVVADLSPKYHAIVDVMVTDQKDFGNIPDDYTGLAWGEATSPYIPNVTGERVSSNHVFAAYEYPRFSWLDVWTSIWVKYDLVPVTSNQPVLVDIGVFLSEWGLPACPDGWQRANGPIQIPYFGPREGTLSFPNRSGLSTGQWPLRCTNRHSVLCARYEPMNETDTFISNVGLSSSGSSAPNCAPWGEANGGYWVMQNDVPNIVHGCDEWRYVCYSRSEAWPEMPTAIEFEDDQKLNLLETYAPRVWFGHNEAFWPSSVEWAFPHLHRTLCGPLTLPGPLPLTYTACFLPSGTPDTSYWLHTSDSLDSPSSVLPFFYGCNGSATGSPCTLTDAPAYAFWVKKHDDKLGFDYVDLIYFFYYPYNRGKEIMDTIFGSHVGDWEHVTVRLYWAYDDQTGEWSLQPKQMYLSAHHFGGTYEWDKIPKVDDTHPIVYSAVGSHGFWLTPGRHKYGEAGLSEDLVDWTGAGTEWDTWNYVETFDYNEQRGLAGSTWPLWMGDDFDDPGICDPSDPACGPIYRWGNPRDGNVFGYYRLEKGPTGPVSKGVWSHGTLK